MTLYSTIEYYIACSYISLILLLFDLLRIYSLCGAKLCICRCRTLYLQMLNSNLIKLLEVSVKCGIFQGNSTCSSWCPILASTSYVEHHNMVARVIHWNLCNLFNLSISADTWFCHRPLYLLMRMELQKYCGILVCLPT